jgi:type IV pilus assembly protein PilQ
MERIVLKGFFRRILWKALVILFLVSPSFSQALPEKGEPLSIQKIEVVETDKGSRVMIEGSKPFEYSATRLENPLRVIVNLPDAQLAKLAGPIQVENGIIKVIRNSQIQDPRKFGARVEIGLEPNVEYSLLSQGNVLYVDLSRPAIISAPKVEEKVVSVKPQVREKAPPVEKPMKGAKFLRDLDISAKAEWVRVEIRADGLMPDYKSFQLEKPARLVVDLPRMLNAYPKRSIDVGSKLLKDIRIGQHPDRLRVVFTFPEPQFPPSQLTKEGQNLIVLLGRMQEELPKKEIAPSAEVPKPIRVAEAEPKEEARRPEAAAPAPMEKPAIEEKELPVELKPAAEEKAAVEEKPVIEEKPVAEAKPPAEVKAAEEVKPAAEVKAAEEVKAPAEVKAVGKPLVTRYRGQKISLDFKDADIHNILRLIGEVSNLNIITSDDVKGKITIRLMSVPWDQALDVILSTKNLIKMEEGNIIRIVTVDTVRKEMEEKQKEETTLIKSLENRENAEELITEAFRLNYAKSTDLARVIMGAMPVGVAAIPGVGPPKPLLSTRGSVRADDRTNTLIIRDTRARIQQTQSVLRRLDLPTPQVLIEARIVQADTAFARTLGVQWGGSYNQTSSNSWAWGLTGNNPNASAGWGFTPAAISRTAETYPYPPTSLTPIITPMAYPGPSNIAMPSNFVVNFPATNTSTFFSSLSGVGISFGKLTGSLVNLDMRLQLGEYNKQSRTISRPKLATLSNIKAYIKQGEEIPYATTSAAGTQVQFKDAVLQLEITPLVTPDKNIKVTVVLKKDSRGDIIPTVGGSIPAINKREAATEVLVKDGETLVIGGIYESENTESQLGVPWLMHIPILGWLFKSREVKSTRNELLIFITPTIIEAEAGS